MDSQDEFGFTSAATPVDGFQTWRQAIDQTKRNLAASMGLPLDHPVEVWLEGEVRLRRVRRLRHGDGLFWKRAAPTRNWRLKAFPSESAK